MMAKSSEETGRRRKVLFANGCYDERLHRGVARYAREKGWDLHGEGATRSAPPVGVDWDGVIVLEHVGWSGLKRIDRIRKCGVPVIVLERHVEKANVARVIIDNYQAGKMAAEYLTSLGFTQYLYLGLDACWYEVEHWKGFSDALTQAGWSPKKACWKSDRGRGVELEQWLDEVVEGLPVPVAVFVGRDALASLFIRYCLQKGLCLPEEVAVLGIPNDEVVCEFSPVPISSIDIYFESLGYEGAHQLDRWMTQGRPPAKPVYVQPRGIVERASTQVLAINDPVVRRAVLFIRENYARPFGVPDVAEHAATNRRTLERAFRRHLHRTVSEEIASCRIRHARELLAGTSLSIVEIASKTGFGNNKYLFHIFRKSTGMTPRQYRLSKQKE